MPECERVRAKKRKKFKAVIVILDVEPEPPFFRDWSWFAEFKDEEEKVKRLRVNRTDAWNFDIYVGLPVSVVEQDEKYCHILNRLRDRKKFVKL